MKIPVGKEYFDEIRKDHAYYVDKTELLYQLPEETNKEVTLFTRPRRFGKTLMLSMMYSVLDKRFDVSKCTKLIGEDIL